MCFTNTPTVQTLAPNRAARGREFSALHGPFNACHMTIEQVGYTFFGDNCAGLQFSKGCNHTRQTVGISQAVHVLGTMVIAQCIAHGAPLHSFIHYKTEGILPERFYGYRC